MPLARARLLSVSRYAVSFDGVDDYARVPHSDALNVASGNKITIEAWAFLTGWQAGYWRGVLIDKRTENTANYNWEFDASAMQFRVHAAGTKWIVSVPHSLNRWNHYAMTLDGPVLRGYLDGVLREERSDVPTTEANTVDLFIGQAVMGHARAKGYVSEVRIYSRALSPEEVRHNFDYPWNPVRDGLVLWLRAHPDYVEDIDGDGMLEWVDLSGYGNHAKLYGAALVEVIQPPKRVLNPARVLAPAR